MRLGGEREGGLQAVSWGLLGAGLSSVQLSPLAALDPPRRDFILSVAEAEEEERRRAAAAAEAAAARHSRRHSGMSSRRGSLALASGASSTALHGVGGSLVRPPPLMSHASFLESLGREERKIIGEWWVATWVQFCCASELPRDRRCSPRSDALQKHCCASTGRRAARSRAGRHSSGSRSGRRRQRGERQALCLAAHTWLRCGQWARQRAHQRARERMAGRGRAVQAAAAGCH